GVGGLALVGDLDRAAGGDRGVVGLEAEVDGPDVDLPGPGRGGGRAGGGFAGDGHRALHGCRVDLAVELEGAGLVEGDAGVLAGEAAAPGARVDDAGVEGAVVGREGVGLAADVGHQQGGPGGHAQLGRVEAELVAGEAGVDGLDPHGPGLVGARLDAQDPAHLGRVDAAEVEVGPGRAQGDLGLALGGDRLGVEGAAPVGGGVGPGAGVGPGDGGPGLDGEAAGGEVEVDDPRLLASLGGGRP